jgi:hypothetical protein
MGDVGAVLSEELAVHRQSLAIDGFGISRAAGMIDRVGEVRQRGCDVRVLLAQDPPLQGERFA